MRFSTARHSCSLVLSSGTFDLGGRRFRLRRVAFPRRPSPEWFVVDLFEHPEQASASPVDLAVTLARALRHGRFDRARLHDVAVRYGTKKTFERVESAIADADA